MGNVKYTKLVENQGDAALANIIAALRVTLRHMEDYHRWYMGVESLQERANVLSWALGCLNSNDRLLEELAHAQSAVTLVACRERLDHPRQCK